MKRFSLLMLMLFTAFLIGSTVAHAELTPPVNDSGDDRVIGAASDEDVGDTSVVDLSGSNTNQPVQSPSEQNTTPAGMAPGGPIEN